MVAFAVFMIYYVAPKHGKKNPLIYLSICSTVGSISICAVKGLGIALKLTLGGKNQLVYPSTYAFMIVTVVAIMTQMNYFNKALSQFSTNMYVRQTTLTHGKLLTCGSVNPLYYVTFTTCTLTASFILFQGFNTTDAVNTISLLCGFLVIFTGVYILNLSRDDPEGIKHMQGAVHSKREVDGIPTDGFAGPLTRRSMQLRRSSEHQRGLSFDMDPLMTPERQDSDDQPPAFGHGYNPSVRRPPNIGLSRDSAHYDPATSPKGGNKGKENQLVHNYDDQDNDLMDYDDDEDEERGMRRPNSSAHKGGSLHWADKL